jgi:hypothetical protein
MSIKILVIINIIDGITLEFNFLSMIIELYFHLYYIQYNYKQYIYIVKDYRVFSSNYKLEASSPTVLVH